MGVCEIVWFVITSTRTRFCSDDEGIFVSARYHKYAASSFSSLFCDRSLRVNWSAGSANSSVELEDGLSPMPLCSCAHKPMPTRDDCHACGTSVFEALLHQCPLQEDAVLRLYQLGGIDNFIGEAFDRNLSDNLLLCSNAIETSPSTW